MKISRTSFVYNANIFDKKSKSLCGFFWQMVFSILTYLCITALGCMLLFVASSPFILLWHYYVESLPIDIVDSAGMFTAIFTLMGSGLYICFGVVRFAEWLKERTEERRRNDYEKWINRGDDEEIEEKQKSVFWEFIKAKKEKVCPIIEYVD